MTHLAKAALFSQGSRVDLARVGALGDPVVSKMLRRQVTRRGMTGTYAFLNVYQFRDSVRGAVAASRCRCVFRRERRILPRCVAINLGGRL
jgi:hypothetical protein